MDVGGGLEKRLQFASQSQSQSTSPPTISQNLASAFRGCKIQSQSQSFPGFELSQLPASSQARPSAVHPQSTADGASQDVLRYYLAETGLPSSTKTPEAASI